MTTTINQKITLSGADDFRNGLKALGQAGQDAFKSVQTAVQQASSTAINFAPVIDAIQKRMENVGHAALDVKEKFGEVGNKFREAGTRLAELGAIILGAEGGFAALILKAGQASDQVIRGAAAAGISTKDYQQMSDTFSVLGVSTEEFTTLINKMNRTFGQNVTQNLELQKSYHQLSDDLAAGKVSASDYAAKYLEIGKNASQTINVFQRLGVTAATAANDPKKAFDQLIDKFSQMPEGIEKAALELEIFGRKGTGLAQIANLGAKEFHRMTEEIERVAPDIDKAQLVIGQKMIISFRTLRLAVENIGQRFALVFGPDLTKLFNAVAEAIANNRDLIIQFAQAALTALQPLIDATIHWLENFKLNPDSFAGIIQGIANLASNVKQFIAIMVGAWNGFVAVMDVVAEGINAIFGTNVSGTALAMVAIVGSLTGVFGALAAAIGAGISLLTLMAAVLGGPIELAIAAVGVAVGYIFGKQLIEVFGAIPGILQNISQALLDGWNGTIQNFKNVWDAGVNFLHDKFAGFYDWFTGIIKTLSDQLKNSLVGRMLGFSGSNSTNDTGPAYAGGGEVRGPGTGTSDSIRAWLSDGEFVVRAQAVQRYGAGLFHALNNMRIPSPAFALGGLVDALGSIGPRDHFAAGGLVAAAAPASSGGRPVILKIGDQSFGPLLGQDNTVARLERFAASKQMRSTGRKPTWQGS